MSFSFAFALKSVSVQLAWFPCTATRIPGDIPTDKVFQVGLTCWEAHPGVCRTDAAGQWNIIEVAGSALLKAGLAKGFVEGSVVRLRVKFGIFVEQMFLLRLYTRRQPEARSLCGVSGRRCHHRTALCGERSSCVPRAYCSRACCPLYAAHRGDRGLMVRSTRSRCTRVLGQDGVGEFHR